MITLQVSYLNLWYSTAHMKLSEGVECSVQFAYKPNNEKA